MSSADTESALLSALGASPDDRELEARLASVLRASGDPRADALELWAKPDLTPAEVRRAETLDREHAQRWLGPLMPLISECRFVRGIPRWLALREGPTETWSAATGDHRLGSIRSIWFESADFVAQVREEPEVRPLPSRLLTQPALANVQRIGCDLRVLHQLESSVFRPTSLAAFAWKPIERLDSLLGYAGLPSVGSLTLALVDTAHALPTIERLLSTAATASKPSLGLGFAADPKSSSALADCVIAMREAGGQGPQRFVIVYAPVFRLIVPGPHFREITVELSRALPFAVGWQSLSGRISLVARTVRQFKLCGIERISVKTFAGARLRRAEIDQLRLACRAAGAELQTMHPSA